MTPTRTRARAATLEREPAAPEHLLQFDFAEAPKLEAPAGRKRRKRPDTASSIKDAIVRWLDQQL